MSYVLAVITYINSAEAKEVILKARGMSITTAVDVAEITRRRFMDKLTVDKIEIGTEEQLRKYEATELAEFLELTHKKCETNAYDQVRYAVVQSGTCVKGLTNIGNFDPKRSKKMCDVVKSAGLLAKEHNSDYLSIQDLQARADCGVDAFNIAPEFGVIETNTLIEELRMAGYENELRKFMVICVASGKWEKWLQDGDPSYDDMEYLTQLCGHYNFTSNQYEAARAKLSNFDTNVKAKLKERIKEITAI